MIGFYETLSTPGIIRLDDIEHIADAQPNEHGVPVHKVTLRTGKTFTIFGSDRGGLLRRPVQLVAAEPGTRMIWIHGSDMITPQYARVVAWALCFDGEVRPVTPNGVCDGRGGNAYVELADGTVEGVGEWTDPSSFTDATAFIDFFVKRAGSSSEEKSWADADTARAAAGAA